jgi:uncharacterized protein YkwD
MVVFMCLAIIGSDLYSAIRNKDVLPTRDEIRIMRDTNEVRREHGLKPVRFDLRLCAAARMHANNMARVRRMSHYLLGGNPGTRAASHGYTHMVGENIAYGYVPTEVVRNSWMPSPSHRQNILDPDWTTIGTGLGANGIWYLCQVFGKE